MTLTCQRCLQAVEVDLAVARAFRFVADEDRAAAEDMDADEEVLATTRSLDLPALVEDELLLALPLVPRHDGACPQPLPQAAAASAQEEAPRQRPFEALAALKGRRSPH
ncbi:DUF177 domain-containing protein [Piscinibacter sakaiensis]|uniref:YceD family protein n=1 Tax=Piscinibacter sakaiensis TaxID=1547922 RepID=UPI003726750D